MMAQARRSGGDRGFLMSRTAFAATAQPVTLDSLRPGDTVVIQPRCACLRFGLAKVFEDEDADLFVVCDRGVHYLEHMLGADGVLVGVSHPGRTA